MEPLPEKKDKEELGKFQGYVTKLIPELRVLSYEERLRELELTTLEESVVGKLFARVVLVSLQILAEKVYHESQCGFRAERSTTDMVFSLRQLQEKCWEQRKALYIAFIDFTKAFDLVCRDELFKILTKIGCPPTLLSMIQPFHKDMKGTVVYDSSTSEPFNINSGAFLLQPCSAFSSQSSSSITLEQPQRASISLQDLMESSSIYPDSEQRRNLKKMQVMGQDVNELSCINIADYELEAVQEFVYLGCTIPDTHSLDTELNRRIGKAATTLARLTKLVWENDTCTLRD
ncbi:uncharacterized protein [Procambarus clarkii]|uniref:uncharacterized protein n=1 Tax=Procambarus clarkii TaxID=6728 RepID=UPI0037425BA0